MTKTIDKVVTNLELSEFKNREMKKGLAPSLTLVRKKFISSKDGRKFGGYYSSFRISYH